MNGQDKAGLEEVGNVVEAEGHPGVDDVDHIGQLLVDLQTREVHLER